MNGPAALGVFLLIVLSTLLILTVLEFWIGVGTEDEATPAKEITLEQAYAQLDEVLFARGHDDVVRELPASIRDEFTAASKPCPSFIDAVHSWTRRTDGITIQAFSGGGTRHIQPYWDCPCGATVQNGDRVYTPPNGYQPEADDPLFTPHNVPHALSVQQFRRFEVRDIEDPREREARQVIDKITRDAANRRVTLDEMRQLQWAMEPRYGDTPIRKPYLRPRRG